jgi:hypothetical protein
MKLLELTWVHMVMRHQVTELAGLLVSQFCYFSLDSDDVCSGCQPSMLYLFFFFSFVGDSYGSADNFGALHPEQFHNCKVQVLPLRRKSPS